MDLSRSRVKMSIPYRMATDRIADIVKQIEEEKKAGLVSFRYDLGWSPDTKADLVSVVGEQV